MVIASAWLTVGAVAVELLVDVAWTVNENVPDAIGMPLMSPVALRPRPDGSAPAARDHELTLFPASCWLYC
jgi:hypothetical protein